LLIIRFPRTTFIIKKMESNNNNDKNYGEEQQQLCGSARKRKFNQLTNDGHGQPAAAAGGEGQQKQHQPSENFSKKNCGGQRGNDHWRFAH
jgi:hypothetical protein